MEKERGGAGENGGAAEKQNGGKELRVKNVLFAARVEIFSCLAA